MTETLWTVTKILSLWNLIVFLIMGLDKLLAKRNARRIPEDTLLLLAFAMGGAGSLLGAWIFHHKTRKLKFKLLLPTALLFNASLLFLLWHFQAPAVLWR